MFMKYDWNSFNVIIYRLKGLCDNVDTLPEPFHDLEVCMSLRQPNTNQPLLLRVRRALGREAPYQMRYLGQPEVDIRRPTLVRSCMDCACSNGILDFLSEMGFRLEFEYIAKGNNAFKRNQLKLICIHSHGQATCFARDA